MLGTRDGADWEKVAIMKMLLVTISLTVSFRSTRATLRISIRTSLVLQTQLRFGSSWQQWMVSEFVCTCITLVSNIQFRYYYPGEPQALWSDIGNSDCCYAKKKNAPLIVLISSNFYTYLRVSVTFQGSSLLVAAHEIISPTRPSISMFVFLYRTTVLAIALPDPWVFACFLVYSRSLVRWPTCGHI